MMCRLCMYSDHVVMKTGRDDLGHLVSSSNWPSNGTFLTLPVFGVGSHITYGYVNEKDKVELKVCPSCRVVTLEFVND